MVLELAWAHLLLSITNGLSKSDEELAEREWTARWAERKIADAIGTAQPITEQGQLERMMVQKPSSLAVAQAINLASMPWVQNGPLLRVQA